MTPRLLLTCPSRLMCPPLSSSPFLFHPVLFLTILFFCFVFFFLFFFGRFPSSFLLLPLLFVTSPSRLSSFFCARHYDSSFFSLTNYPLCTQKDKKRTAESTMRYCATYPRDVQTPNHDTTQASCQKRSEWLPTARKVETYDRGNYLPMFSTKRSSKIHCRRPLDIIPSSSLFSLTLPAQFCHSRSYVRTHLSARGTLYQFQISQGFIV